MYDTRYIHHEIYAYEYIDIDIDQADWVGGVLYYVAIYEFPSWK